MQLNGSRWAWSVRTRYVIKMPPFGGNIVTDANDRPRHSQALGQLAAVCMMPASVASGLCGRVLGLSRLAAWQSMFRGTRGRWGLTRRNEQIGGLAPSSGPALCAPARLRSQAGLRGSAGARRAAAPMGISCLSERSSYFVAPVEHSDAPRTTFESRFGGTARISDQAASVPFSAPALEF